MPPPVTAKEVPSPCIRMCTLDDDVCVGCGRHIREITGWSAADPQARQRIVEAAEARLAERRLRYQPRTLR
ncbi:MAG: DUF1289 domain-containing protein [Nevskia sp.]|nr:DUF1289 domain-containing protein [Nevskia sp.]